MNFNEEKNIQKITENIYVVIARNNGQFPDCNGFLFTGEQNILIDAGADEELIRRIDSKIGIDTLVISHSHPDHFSRWSALSHRKLLVPEETPDSVFDLNQLGERFTGTSECGLHWAVVMGKAMRLQALRQPDGRYSDGDIFDIGSARIEAVHAPGHLDDHYCFFEHITGTLITTDIDFTTFGPWYGNPESKVKTFIDSVRKVMLLPYSRACSSHKLPHEGDATNRFNSFLLAFERQKSEVYEFLGNGKTLDEITLGSPIYNNKFFDRTLQHVFEKYMASENLSVLIEEGRVKNENGLYIPII